MAGFKPRLTSVAIFKIYGLFNAFCSSFDIESKALNVTMNCEKLNVNYVVRRMKEELELIEAVFQYFIEVLRKHMKWYIWCSGKGSKQTPPRKNPGALRFSRPVQYRYRRSWSVIRCAYVS
jgi:hypothetical protein